MILPNPSDIKNIEKFPLTLTLVGLNIFLFILIFSGQQLTLSRSPLLQEEQLILSGKLYFQYLQQMPATALYEKPEWVRQMSSDNADQMEILGSYSLRDSEFLNLVESKPFWGDEVKIQLWKKDVRDFRALYSKQLMFRFGLSSLEKRPLSWLTYQFSHSNWIHLLSNMMFLIVIGAAVEALAGSGFLIFIYLIGGLFGGWGFLIFEAAGTVPMVGASASVSALLAFYCAAETRRRIRYFFFISPMNEHMGHIYLPTLTIVPLFLVIDIANFWSSPEGLNGSVAYAAHLGGTFFGLVFGFGYRWWMQKQPRQVV